MNKNHNSNKETRTPSLEDSHSKSHNITAYSEKWHNGSSSLQLNKNSISFRSSHILDNISPSPKPIDERSTSKASGLVFLQDNLSLSNIRERATVKSPGLVAISDDVASESQDSSSKSMSLRFPSKIPPPPPSHKVYHSVSTSFHPPPILPISQDNYAVSHDKPKGPIHRQPSNRAGTSILPSKNTKTNSSKSSLSRFPYSSGLVPIETLSTSQSLSIDYPSETISGDQQSVSRSRSPQAVTPGLALLPDELMSSYKQNVKQSSVAISRMKDPSSSRHVTKDTNPGLVALPDDFMLSEPKSVILPSEKSIRHITSSKPGLSLIPETEQHELGSLTHSNTSTHPGLVLIPEQEYEEEESPRFNYISDSSQMEDASEKVGIISGRISLLPETAIDLSKEMDDSMQVDETTRSLVTNLLNEMKGHPLHIPLNPTELKSLVCHNCQYPYICIKENSYLNERYYGVESINLFYSNPAEHYNVTCETLITEKGHHFLFCEWRKEQRTGRAVIVNARGNVVVVAILVNGLFQDYLVELNDGNLANIYMCYNGYCKHCIRFNSRNYTSRYHFTSMDQCESLSITVYYPDRTKAYEGKAINNLTDLFPVDGKGIFYNKEQKTYSGVWSDGKLKEYMNIGFYFGRKCPYLDLFSTVLKEDYERKMNGYLTYPLENKNQNCFLWIAIMGVIGIILFLLLKAIPSKKSCIRETIMISDNFWIGCVENEKTAGEGSLMDAANNLLYSGNSVNNIFEGQGISYEVLETWEEDFTIEPFSVVKFDGLWEAGLMKRGQLYLPELYFKNDTNVLWYDGSFVNGLREGPGIEYWPGHCVHYSGTFKKDQFWHGKVYNRDCKLEYEGPWTGSVFELNKDEEVGQLNPQIHVLRAGINLSLNVSNAVNVEEVYILKDSLQNATQLNMDHLPKLQVVHLQSGVLSHVKNVTAELPIVSIQRNPQLHTLTMKTDSLYTIKRFCLNKNPNLRTITIFQQYVNTTSFMFYSLPQFELNDLPSLTSVVIPSGIHMPNVESIGFINLPNLKLIRIRKGSMLGKGQQTDITFIDCPLLETVIIEEGACKFVQRVRFKNVPKLSSFIWSNTSFINIESVTFDTSLNITIKDEFVRRFSNVKLRPVTFSYIPQQC